MKELTEKEKARRYDEALKVLHKYDGVNTMFSQSLKEEMFPELKENEDGNIIEEIKGLVESAPLIMGLNKDKIFAWLEQKSAPQWKPSDEQITWLVKILV